MVQLQLLVAPNLSGPRLFERTRRLGTVEGENERERERERDVPRQRSVAGPMQLRPTAAQNLSGPRLLERMRRLGME